ncbi:MAG: cytochrome c [Lysobacteraceae bacterium]
MRLITRHSSTTVLVLALSAMVGLGLFVWLGFYNMAADDPHLKPTYNLLQTLRERSIAVRAAKLEVPADLNSPERIKQGAGNYNAMCMGCHLAPGMGETELSKGLYPAPPNLTKEEVGAANAFWVIKHGIKGSGMPAWGKSMDDVYIWNIAAFLQVLPKLDAQQYQALVESSGGHSHGGGETKPHEHPEGVEDDHGDGAADGHGDMKGMVMEEAKSHDHPAGTPAHDETAVDHSAMKMNQAPAAKPHSHAPGTPPHDDGPSAAKPATDEHAGMVMPETQPEEHKNDGHQH